MQKYIASILNRLNRSSCFLVYLRGKNPSSSLIQKISDRWSNNKYKKEFDIRIVGRLYLLLLLLLLLLLYKLRVGCLILITITTIWLGNEEQGMEQNWEDEEGEEMFNNLFETHK